MARWWPRFLRRPRRSPAARLPRPPRAAHRVPVPHLHAHTAESLVVLTTAPEALPALRSALDRGTALRLTCPGARDVTLMPGEGPPALDPDEGWLIPLPEETREFLLHGVPEEPGAWELPGTNVGLMLE